MKTGTYFKNAAILTATGLLLRVAGMFFRIYIAGKIGAGGMGLYQLLYSVYALAITLATAGVSVVATRITAGLLAQNKTAELRSAGVRLIALGGILGLLSALALYNLAELAAVYWLRDIRAAQPLRILAPSLPFMAASAALRGIFMAQRKVTHNAKAQIYEQVIRIALVVSVLSTVNPEDMEACCCAVVLGNTVSEAMSWCYMQWCYRRETRALPQKKTDLAKPSRLLQLLVPIAASQYVTSILRTLENILVPNCLAIFLLSRETALEQYGALKGMAMPLLFFPFSFIGTLATLLLPEITEAYEKRNQKTLQHLVHRVITITLMISILAGTLYAVLAYDFGELFYHDSTVGFYIRILGPLTPFMYMESMVDGILKGLDQQVATFRYTVADSMIRIVLISLLLPRFGMQGFLFVMLVSNLFTSLLNLNRMLLVTEMQFDWMEWLIKPVSAGVCGSIACRYIFTPLAQGVFSQWFFALCAFCIITGVYLLFLYLVGSLSILQSLMPKKRLRRA